MSKTKNFSNDGSIDPIRVKTTVYNRIDFELPEETWVEIDNGFAECWNNEIGIRGWVHEGQIEKFIYNHLKKRNILFEYAKVEQIVKIMLDYIKMTGGYLKE